MITVDLLRHGELVGGIKYRGQTDDPLTREGLASMYAVWKRLQNKVDLIITSPLSRCRRPAMAWAESKGIECIVDARLSELHYGEWEGMTPDEIREKYPDLLEQWRRDPESVLVPGGESIHDFQARIAQFWEELCRNHKGQRLLVVAHSGSIRMLIAEVMNAPIISTRSMQMPYASWSRVSHEKGNSHIEFLNRKP